MGVQSSPFGAVRISGEDAKAFLEQIVNQPAKKQASSALETGRKMVKELKEQGFVSLGRR